MPTAPGNLDLRRLARRRWTRSPSLTRQIAPWARWTWRPPCPRSGRSTARQIVETFYRGRSATEAAAALGIPAGTVKSRTYYGLKALKLVLQERGVTL